MMYSYESFLKNKESSDTTKSTSKFQKVGYFSLKNDGDVALVRFAYKTSAEFNITTVHTVEIDGRYKRVSCLRESGKEPVSKCPLCEAGEKLYSKFYVKLIEYTKDESGNVVATPKVWERPSGFAQQLEPLCAEYGGDLCDHIFKIKRRGAKGDMQTTYDVMYANPELYKESVGYVKDFSAFDNFDLSRHSYYVKSFEEISEFLETGKFPDTVKAVEKEDEDESRNLDKVFPTKADEVKAEEVISHQVRPVAEAPVQTSTTTASSSNPYMRSGFTAFSDKTPNYVPETSSQTDPTFSRPRRTPQSDIYK